MYTVEITVDIISAIYLLIIIIGVYNISVKESDNTKAYKRCLWTCFVGLIIDASGYALNGIFHSNLLIWLLTYCAFFLSDIMMAFYAVYIHTYIKEKKGRVSDNFPRICLFLCLLDVVVQTYGSVTGKLFTVENGAFILGPWYGRTYSIPVICLFIGIIYLLRNVKYFGFTDIVIFSMYSVLLILTALMWSFGQYFISMYVANAIALTIIFVMIQFRVISEANMQAEIFNTLSIRDALTGLRNRRSYDDCLSGVLPEAAVCAVFCDVNFLKKVNDTLGHEAGDNLLKRMANILKEVFEDEEIFRISGDEFVVILQNIDASTSLEKINALKKRVYDNDRIAAMGSACGKGSDVLKVIKAAEQEMYADKTAFYKEVDQYR